jgi:tight adherence protein B
MAMIPSEWLMYGAATGAVGCATIALQPLAQRLWMHSKGRVEAYQDVKVAQASKTLDDMFEEAHPKRLKIVYGIVPIGLGLGIFLITHQVWLAVAGTVVGVFVPDAWVRYRHRVRQRKFKAQLVDALLILSSSLRAGLSLTQAFEQLEAEISPPASQEFGLMLKAHRVGRTLEEALQGLNNRMPSDELQLLTTAVLVARETGGDVTEVIGQLVTTIRDRQKLADKVNTLTLQGRLQAYLLSALPVVFAIFVRTFNPNFFNVLIEDATGRSVLAVACVLWVIGMFLLMRMSRVNT